MRIAIVALADFDTSSSTVRRVHMIGKGLAALGHEANIVVAQRFRPGPLVSEMDGLTIYWGTTTTPQNWSGVAARLKARWATVRLINRLAKRDLDWLVLYNLGLEGLPLITVARRKGARIGAEYCDVRTHTTSPGLEGRARTVWHGLADTLVPRCTDLNLAISRFLEQWLRDKAPRTPTLIVPPLVDTDQFQEQPEKARSFREKWQIGNTPIIAYLGSYWCVEGVANLLQSAGILKASGGRFRLLISGAVVPGRECDDVTGMVRTMGLDDCVLQTGWLPTHEVIAAMSAADILVVPKIDDVANRAGVATKMAEYLSMGRAVVATRVGDVPLYLQNGENCLLCTPGKVPELTEALRRLLIDSSLRAHIGAGGRRTAHQHFDYRAAGQRIEHAMLQANRNLRPRTMETRF
jgi:glycosyltransferase involved in cell wall biosynthesis